MGTPIDPSARDGSSTTSSTYSGISRKPLYGKLAIISGGSRELASSIAEDMASKGCNLALAFGSIEMSEVLAAALSRLYGVEVCAVSGDVSSPTGPASIIAQVRRHFARNGRVQIDIIINNATMPPDLAISEIMISQFQYFFAVNVQGPLFLVQAAMPYLPQNRSGRIININSPNEGAGGLHQSIHAATKSALDGMMRQWSRELVQYATVNSIEHGHVITAPETPSIQNGKGPAGKPRESRSKSKVTDVKEIAGLVSMLCSTDSRWCTGSTISTGEGRLFGV
ncbi:NAD(P)-binding protein [Thozetella sp. PMI_491]|nr:NAD(P)-binding protein [Thozetella sp. PMI_491]